MSQKTIRQVCRSIDSVHRLYGLYQYLCFRVRLARQNRAEKREGWKPDDGFPLPPARLRYRVHGSLDPKDFLRVGQECAADIEHLLRLVGRDLSSFRRVLDFGCGCGRVLRNLRDHEANCSFQGTDIDPESIAWNSEHLAELAQWTVNTDRPPLAAEDDTFDLIYGISVFTHLDEQYQFEWLSELKRISKSKGYLILTVRGDRHESLDEPERARLEQRGFLFKTGLTGALKLDGLPDFYQTTFHTREYVDREWSKYFTIVRFVKGAINDHHDAVILRNE